MAKSMGESNQLFNVAKAQQQTRDPTKKAPSDSFAQQNAKKRKRRRRKKR